MPPKMMKGAYEKAQKQGGVQPIIAFFALTKTPQLYIYYAV